eukprot:jgi/Chlat1/9010/Chrsp94S08348
MRSCVALARSNSAASETAPSSSPDARIPIPPTTVAIIVPYTATAAAAANNHHLNHMPIRRLKAMPILRLEPLHETHTAIVGMASVREVRELASDRATLRDGSRVPRVGLGVARAKPGGDTRDAVKTALQARS